MKIVPIFEDKLFAFHYKNEADDEYNRLMDLWTNVDYLYAYAKENLIYDASAFVETILRNAEDLQDWIAEIHYSGHLYGLYFKPLQISESTIKQLSFQKGKIFKNQLRLYALKIEEDCFVITGGAIKMTQTMQEHPDTVKELDKLLVARVWLKEQGVFDKDSFFELIIEENDD